MSGYGSGRDSQRSKLYTAEDALLASEYNHSVTLEEAQQLVDKICQSKVLAKKFGKMTIKVVPHRGRGGVAKYETAWGGQRQIALGQFALSKLIVIHEVAHHMAGFQAQHGWKFARTYLDIVRNQMGQDAEKALRYSFREHKVKFNPPRKKRGPVSDEQRAELTARLAAARAAKDEKRAAAEQDMPALPEFNRITRSVGGVPWTSGS